MLCLLGLLLPFLPLHRAWSVDAHRNPRLRSQTVPTWVLWVLRAQIGLVYVFGGIAKLNARLASRRADAHVARESHDVSRSSGPSSRTSRPSGSSPSAA